MLYLVMADTNGAHEDESVYSIWSTQELADLEIKRLKSAGISAGCYGGSFYVVSVAIDTQRDECIF